MSDSTQRTKCCTKCGLCKPLQAFHRDPKGADGRSRCCADCAKKRAAEWHKTNKDKALLKSKQWRKANAGRQRELNRACAKRYSEENPNVISERNRSVRERLTDGYVRQFLPEQFREVNELVNVKREHIRLQRLVSQLKQAQPKGTK